MNNIDVIFYINLESRKDREAHFQTEIVKLCTDKSKIIRIDAIRNNIGLLGCVYSHIKAIEEFEKNPEWKTCIIFEDDFTFRSDDISFNDAQLSLFLNEFKTWDMLTLSYNPRAFHTDKTHVDEVVKVLSTQTTSGYCLHKNFSTILKQNFIESSIKLADYGKPNYSFALDIYWKSLQPTSNWYAIVPSIGYQYISYSDIWKKEVNYKC